MTEARRPVPAPEPPPPSGADVGDDLVAAFGREIERAGGRLVVAQGEAEARAVVEAEVRGRRTVDAAGDPAEEALRDAEVGIDDADLLIAEAGTVVRTFRSRTHARVSLVPPVTIFRAKASDLVRDLPEAFARLAKTHREGRARTVFVTGPSRTADIEKQLVIPAHGPREVIVVLRP